MLKIKRVIIYVAWGFRAKLLGLWLAETEGAKFWLSV